MINELHIFKALFNQAALGVAQIDTQSGRFLRVNKKYCDLVGYTEDEMLKLSFQCITHPNDLAKDLALMEKLKNSAINEFTMDKRYITKQGTVVWVALTVSPLWKSGEHPDFHMAMVQDISERKFEELQIKNLNQFYSVINYCSQSILHCQDENELFSEICKNAVLFGKLEMAWIGVINFKNQMLEPVAYYGEGAEEYLDHIRISVDSCSELGRGPSGISIRENRPVWNQDFLNNPNLTPWMEIARKVGWQSSASLPIQKNGATIGALALYSHEAYAFNKATQGLLEQMTRDIGYRLDKFDSDKKLFLAKEEAVQLAQAKSAFLANMSHEIRTPLNAVIGFSSLGQDEDSVEIQRDYMQKINQAATGLLGIINDILDFSKNNAGKLNLESISFEIEKVLFEIEDLLNISPHQQIDFQNNNCSVLMKRQMHYLINENLYFYYELDQKIPQKLIGDPLRIRQILTNILSNAFKFTNAGEIYLKIKLLSREQQNLNIEFTVGDTGIGMNAQQLNQLFQPFQQGDTSTTRRYGGTGLGLVIAEQLIKAMRGKIRCESELDIGSCFVFNLQLQADENNSASGCFNNDFCAKPHSAHILLVEDNEVNKSLATIYLQNAGMTVSAVDDGQQAVNFLTDKTVDLVLMDIQMPKMDGIEATKYIRQQLSLCELPIIALTAHAFPDEKQKILDAGMNDLVTKPMCQDALWKVLNDWL